VLVCVVGVFVALGAGVRLLTAPAHSTDSLPIPPPAAPRVESAAPSPKAKVAYALPVRLVIPDIDVDAKVERVGLTASNAMASPSGPDPAGWYKYGPRPGERGSAVIDGHSGYADGQAAVFDDLPELDKGDEVYIEDARGRRLTFIVRRKKLYARDASAAEVFAETRSRRLNLITCTGSFDEAAGTHTQRLVVFAELQPDDQGTRQ
jgi:LPXTG-site transpeptidase (sortase) family protein